MKKFLASLVLGLLFSGCAPNMSHLVMNKTFGERVELINDRHSRINLFDGDIDKIYVNTKFGTMPLGYPNSIEDVAKRLCRTKLNSQVAKYIGSRTMTKTEIKELILHGTKYEIYRCERNKKINISENKTSNNESTNKLNRTFTCSFANNPNEKSTIKIRGGSASETTAVGVLINYSKVSISSKGAFTLEQSSKPGRAWFIGAKSFLLLDVAMYPYSCN